MTISPALAYDTAINVDVQGYKSELNELRDSISDLATDTKNEIENKVSTVKDFVLSAAISTYAKNFGNRADESSLEAKKWLQASRILCYFLIGYGFFLLIFPFEVKNTAEAISSTAAKIIIFSTLFTGLVLSTKIYRALRHTQEVNKHRDLALRTFEAFVETAGKSEDIRNAVLLQTTQCIFSAQQTGYLGKDEDSPTGSTQIIEILKSITPATKD